MRSAVTEVMPQKLRRQLQKLGRDIETARLRREITVESMLERTGIAKATYQRVARGDPTVQSGIYLMCLFVLGLSDGLFDAVDPSNDTTGQLLDQERRPRRIRKKSTAGGEAL